MKKIRDVAVSFVNAVIEFVCSVLCILYFIIFLMFGLLENLVWLMVKDKTVLCAHKEPFQRQKNSRLYEMPDLQGAAAAAAHKG